MRILCIKLEINHGYTCTTMHGQPIIKIGTNKFQAPRGSVSQCWSQ